MSAVEYWAGIDSCLLDSSVWSEPPEITKVWVTLLLLKDRNGFVRNTKPGLARRANVSLEWTIKALEKFESPDPLSSDPENEGRKIKAVERGWIVLNHFKYQERMKVKRKQPEAAAAKLNLSNGNENTPPLASSPGEERDLSRRRDTNPKTRIDVNVNVNSRTPAIAELPPPAIVELESFSAREREAFESLTVDSKRKLFLIVRGWAAHAAGKDEPDFQVAQGYLAKELRCDQRNVSKIVKEFRDLGIIEQTADYVFKQSPARYRWALETTLPIPAQEEKSLDL